LPWRGRGGILGEARDVGGAVITLDAIWGTRRRLLAVAARYGARNLRVSGPVARGEATAVGAGA
jgi:hypothetical protein